MQGVMHVIDSLLLPEGALAFTAEKSLLTLNATRFVSLLRSSGLSDLVQSTNVSRTVLAPRDDVIQGWEGRWASLPDEGTEELKEILQYHVLEGAWPSEKLNDGMLLGTELVKEQLKGGRQRMAVSVSGEDVKVDRADKGGKDRKVIGFGGANVIGEPGK
jgi:solute carrier family 25 carnitine/acylcarnitine transporter 20/29